MDMVKAEIMENKFKHWEELESTHLQGGSWDAMQWEAIDGLEVEDVIKGMSIIGAEPMDYPITDGITLYMGNKQGKVLALEIYSDIYTEDKEINPFTIKLARAPEA